MFAITENGYRAVSDASELIAGETMVDSIPDQLLKKIDATEARQQRTELLRSTDWTMATDANLTTTQRAAYANYRQQLRALPEVPGFPDCDWPAAPSLPDGTAGGGIKAPGIPA